MAILNLEWLLISNPHPPSPFPTTTLISISVPRSSPVPSLTAGRLVIVCSAAGSSSSLLEEASNELQQIQFSSKPASFTPPSISGIGSTDIFVDRLGKSPRTGDFSLEYYQKARLQPGFRLDHGTLRILVRQLLRSKNWSLVSDLSEDIRSSGVFPDKATCGRLVGGCIRARKFKDAESLLVVFETRGGIAAAAFGTALRGYNRLHMYNSAVLVYERMMAAGVLLDPGCYCWVMEAYSKLGNVDEVVSLFEEFASKNLASPPDQFRTQINFILCDSLGRSGRAFEALRYFREMTAKGVSPDSSLYSSLVCSFAGIKEAEIAEDLFQEAREKGQMKDPAVFLKLVLMYVEVGLIGKTLEVVKVMKEMGMGVSDCISCAVVNGHAKKGGLRASVRAYEEMISLGCVPGQVTYASVINVYCRLGLTAKAEKTFEEMLERGFHKCVVAYSNMVSMYGKASRVRDAMRLLAKMKEKGCQPNVWVYNSLIDMHGRVLNLRQVEKLWKEMKRRKIEPDKVSYTSIIGAYSKAKEFKECAEFYQEFRLNGGKIDRVMAGIMVGVFSKTSRIDELLKLLRDVKLEGIRLDDRLYMSSLNALRDAGLHARVEWFKETFAYVKIRRKPGEERCNIGRKCYKL